VKYDREFHNKIAFLKKSFVEIRDISYGEFPEVFGLNKRFKPGGKKLKVVLDVFVPQNDKGIGFPSVYRKLLKLLPTLEKHKCGENLFEGLRDHKENPQGKPEQMTHIAHLIEHVIIDLQSNITKMDSCSGITCGYKNPEHRFDLFIECRDEDVGRFSAFFAVDLLKKLLLGKTLAKKHFRLIELVKYLYQNKSFPAFGGIFKSQKRKLISLDSKVASDLGWTKRSVVSLMKELTDFGFFDSKRALPNLVTL
jgi:hypothetical protein